MLTADERAALRERSKDDDEYVVCGETPLPTKSPQVHAADDHHFRTTLFNHRFEIRQVAAAQEANQLSRVHTETADTEYGFRGRRGGSSNFDAA